MRYQDDINTEHNMKSIGHAAVSQWTERLTRKGQREFESERRAFLILQILLFINKMDFGGEAPEILQHILKFMRVSTESP